MQQNVIEKEETLIIKTPERVPLEFALASIGNRFLAVAVDHFIQYFSIFLIAWFFFSLVLAGVCDRCAGTVVVRERQDEAPTFAETFSTPVRDAAFLRVQKKADVTANIDLLSEREVKVVEIFLRRRWDLTDRQRLWMAWRIALPLMYKLKPGYNLENFTYEGFLEEILHRFHTKQRFLN